MRLEDFTYCFCRTSGVCEGKPYMNEWYAYEFKRLGKEFDFGLEKNVYSLTSAGKEMKPFVVRDNIIVRGTPGSFCKAVLTVLELREDLFLMGPPFELPRDYFFAQRTEGIEDIAVEMYLIKIDGGN